MNTSWIDLPIGHPDYIVGCTEFIDFAKEAPVEGKILCPCKKCKVEKWFPMKEVEGHILFKGFFTPYKNWFFHGNGNIRDRIFSNDEGSIRQGSVDNMSGLLGFGVKQSDIYGVRSLVSHGRRGHVNNPVEEIKSLRAELTLMSEENQALVVKVDENNKNFKMITSNIAKVLRDIRDGNASTEMLDGAEAALNLVNNEESD